ncbi:MAG: outer membrane lipid asymmetry maintenance protein MlaD [Proteobacteria bacterium]|nr:outer membrane lipid asymmetry maintenance protein MlaD [Pseudomonadota bacterium]
MNGNLFEALIGALVLLVAGFFLVFAFTTADIGAVQGYEVVAKFDRVDGLNIGSDVRLSGIKVGTVVSQDLDRETFLAVVRMTIESDVRLPKDSSAQIVTDGLLGGKFMAIVPGGDPDYIEPGGEITFTQGPLILENLIGQFVFGAGDNSSDEATAP